MPALLAALGWIQVLGGLIWLAIGLVAAGQVASTAMAVGVLWAAGLLALAPAVGLILSGALFLAAASGLADLRDMRESLRIIATLLDRQ